MSAQTDIVDAIVTRLNAASLSQDFTSSKTYHPKIDRATSGLKVYVWPQSETIEIASRVWTGDYSFEIAVAVRKPVTVSEDVVSASEMDAMLLLMENIKDDLRSAGQMSGASLTTIEQDPLWDPISLEEHHLFHAEAIFTYRELRG